MKRSSSITHCGRTFTDDDIGLIKEICGMYKKLSRTELANTVCELLDWTRPTGKLKSVECSQFLEKLEEQGKIVLPGIRSTKSRGVKTKVRKTGQTDAPDADITGPIDVLKPIALRRVTTKPQRDLWYEYVDRYHYLGYQLPFGAQLRYFIEDRQKNLLGCLQFSSPAWKMAPRDKWIGWSREQRKANLQRIINNSRFLIFPWVKVKNLASSILALVVRTVPHDWEQTYNYHPVLLETLVDNSRFTGTCYKASNWVYLGETTGRGRMDRAREKIGHSIKAIYVYPLTRKFRQELAGNTRS